MGKKLNQKGHNEYIDYYISHTKYPKERLSKRLFRTLLFRIGIILGDELKEGREIILPHPFGKIVPTCYILDGYCDKNGTIKRSRHFINHAATRELYEKDPEAKRLGIKMEYDDNKEYQIVWEFCAGTPAIFDCFRFRAVEKVRVAFGHAARAGNIVFINNVKHKCGKKIIS